MGCPSEVEIGDNLVFTINTHTASTGAATDATGSPSYRVYEDETGTAILTGSMAKLDDANTLGFYSESIACTSGNGFENGKTYTIYISATVSAVEGTVSYGFKAYDQRKSNVKQISDDSTAADNLELALENGTAGYVASDMKYLNGGSQSAIDLKDFADDGYDPATNKVQGVVLVDTVTTLTGHTAQTGDSFSRIGANGAGLTNINLPNQTMDITGNITGNLSGSVGSVTGAVGSVTAAVTTDAASRTASQADVSALATTAELNKVPKSDGTTTWNSTALASIQTEANDAIVANGLDHLVGASVTGTDVADNSIIAKMVSKSATADWDSFNNTTDSLEAAKDTAFDYTSDQVTVGTNNDKTGYIASTVSDKTGYSLTADQSSVTIGTINTVGDKTGYSLSTAGIKAIWDQLTSALSTAGSIGKKLTDWVLGTDNKVLLSTDAQTGVTIPTVTTVTGGATEAKQDTAQADLDIITGTDGVTLATSQGNYTPATASALATTDGKIDTIDTNVDTLLTKLPTKPKKNTAIANFVFPMVNATDKVTFETGLTVTATRSIDGAAYASCTNSVTEIGATGKYKIDLSAADMNGDTISLNFDGGATALVREFFIQTQE